MLDIDAILKDLGEDPLAVENGKFYRELCDSSEEGDTTALRDYVNKLMKQNSMEPHEGDEEEEEEEEEKPKQRALDRSLDIEYFTNEMMGPRRELTPEGFMICYDVPVARVGEMIYAPGEVPSELGSGRDGRVRVARVAREVFAAKSMASLNGKPVTDDHPPVDVDPKNWAFYTKGVVVNPRRGEGEQSDFLITDLIIYDQEMIQDIENDKREVSCGYNPDYIQFLDEDDNPIAGRGEQINIRYNHLALVKAGRCGPACAIGDSRTVAQDAALDDDGFFSERRAKRFAKFLKRFKE